MLCDNCKERDAVINLTQVEHDSKVTLHLCERCAQEKGVETGVTVLKSPLGGLSRRMGKAAPGSLPTRPDGLPWAGCAGTLRDFGEAGRLGGGQCYEGLAQHFPDL